MTDNELNYNVVIERISTGVYDVEYSKPKTLLKDTDIEAIKEAKKKGPLKFEDDLKSAIMSEHGLNSDQASRVYWKAYEDGHSAGMHEILWNAQELGLLAEAILWLA